MLCLCRVVIGNNGKENGNYYSILGLYWDSGHAAAEERVASVVGLRFRGLSIHPLNPKP